MCDNYTKICKDRFDGQDEKLDMILKLLCVGNGGQPMDVRVALNTMFRKVSCWAASVFMALCVFGVAGKLIYDAISK